LGFSDQCVSVSGHTAFDSNYLTSEFNTNLSTSHYRLAVNFVDTVKEALDKELKRERDLFIERIRLFTRSSRAN
jgi:hypothetical protein